MNEERPLVTLALFAYNQDNYVREAIEGAFAQTYEPLEIILSDDQSSDGTFQVMHAMAVSYTGPHRVRAIRQEKNLGTVNHVITVAKQAAGKYFVVNAGDDVSYPDRVARIAEAFEADTLCVNSTHDEVDSHGVVLRANQSFPYSPTAQWLFRGSSRARRPNGYIESAVGFCAAYRTDFWARMSPSEHKLLVEDGLATVLINAMGGGIIRVRKPLIAYRLHDSSLSLRQSGDSMESILLRESKISAGGREIVRSVDYALHHLKTIGQEIEPAVLRALRTHQHYGSMVWGFWDASWVKRFGRLLSIRSREELAYILPRSFGQKLFVLFKQLSLRRASAVNPSPGQTGGEEA